jgi:hypothetical protein
VYFKVTSVGERGVKPSVLKGLLNRYQLFALTEQNVQRYRMYKNSVMNK